MKKADIKNMETIAYYSGFGGIEIKHIEFDIEDYIYYIAGAFCSNKTYHKSKVYGTIKGGLYFMFKGHRIPINECIRCN